MNLKAKDYRSQLEPVWCTGCGDYGVLKGLTQAFADLELKPENLGVISGRESFSPDAIGSARPWIELNA